MTDHVTRDIQEQYTNLVDLVNNLQTNMGAVKNEQDRQKREFEKEMKELTSFSRSLRNQLDAERKKHNNEIKTAASLHNDEIATLTARCDSLQTLVETQQQQIASLQTEVTSLQVSQSLSNIRATVDSDNVTNVGPPSADNPHANHTTTLTEAKTQESTPTAEVTQPVLRHTEEPATTREPREVRVYTDSIWKAVDVTRMFPNRSTCKDNASTIDHATKKIAQLKDPKTAYAIFYVGSNDLSNSKHDPSSVTDCLEKTKELVAQAKTCFPNAQIILSQVLPRGDNLDSDLNKNIKDYNQSVLQQSKDDRKTMYVRHKKLSTTRHLYKRDGIHLDNITGTSLLVADVKRTIRSVEDTQRANRNRDSFNQSRPATIRNIPPPVESEYAGSNSKKWRHIEANKLQRHTYQQLILGGGSCSSIEI
ncbi:hypothetical protein Bbelb_109410 [Branchiostoma belcheri]|nr:hypothetical protein Bbelb_109410 [Branchiostoma belcheri]